MNITVPKVKIHNEFPFIISENGELSQPRQKTLAETKKLALSMIENDPLVQLTIVLPHLTYQTKPSIKETRHDGLT